MENKNTIQMTGGEALAKMLGIYETKIMFGIGGYQSSDLLDMNYAEIFKSMGGRSVRVETPESLEGALREGITEKTAPVLIDMVTTRDPEFMLPAADARTRKKS